MGFLRSIAVRAAAAAALLAAVVALAPAAAAAGLSLIPPKFEFEANPGETLTGTIELLSTDAGSMTLTASVQDFVAGNETGQPQFVDTSAASDASSYSSRWYTVGTGQPLVLRAGERLRVPFTVAVPQDAPPGGHYAAVFFTPPAGEGQVAVTQRIGSLVLIRVRGDIREEGEIAQWGTYPASIAGEQLADASAQFFWSKLPVDFAIRYHNTGNVHLRPEGKIELFGTFGGQLEKIGVQSILNEGGVETKKEIVDYLPVNNDRGNVLKDSYRTFRASWQGTPYWQPQEDGTRAIAYRGMPLGWYTARLTLTGPGGEAQVAETSFIVFPWQVVVPGLLGIIILFFGIRAGLRWHTRSVERRIRQMMEQHQRTKGE